MTLAVDELVLLDPDRDRLEVVGGSRRGSCAAGHARNADPHPRSGGRSTAPTRCWCSCASAARRARLHDETVPLACGCVGQETTGAGGLAKALRTVPVVLDIADEVRRAPRRRVDRRLHQPRRHRHPRAARRRAPGARPVQRGDRPAADDRRAARVEPGGCSLDQVGLNHLTWIRRVLLDGVDVLPGLLDEHAARWPTTSSCRSSCCVELGAVPSYYLRYYYAHDAVVAEQRRGAPGGAGARPSRTSCCGSTATRR